MVFTRALGQTRQDLSCTYLAHHELESVFIIIIIIIIVRSDTISPAQMPTLALGLTTDADESGHPVSFAQHTVLVDIKADWGPSYQDQNQHIAVAATAPALPWSQPLHCF